ncbi:hypothetical protein NKG94_31965 [Micromonospora sp. M12]
MRLVTTQGTPARCWSTTRIESPTCWSSAARIAAGSVGRAGTSPGTA